jgi:hypothetical protein
MVGTQRADARDFNGQVLEHPLQHKRSVHFNFQCEKLILLHVQFGPSIISNAL